MMKVWQMIKVKQHDPLWQFAYDMAVDSHSDCAQILERQLIIDHDDNEARLSAEALVGVLANGSDDGDDYGDDGDVGTGVLTRAKPKTKKPSMYKVLLLNDDFTPMEFVVHVLQRYFRKTIEEATDVMLQVHKRGVGVCGVYTYEVAETKVNQVMTFARQNEQPLQCTMEKE